MYIANKTVDLKYLVIENEQCIKERLHNRRHSKPDVSRLPEDPGCLPVPARDCVVFHNYGVGIGSSVAGNGRGHPRKSCYHNSDGSSECVVWKAATDIPSHHT